jgi:hypothetical protein
MRGRRVLKKNSQQVSVSGLLIAWKGRELVRGRIGSYFSSSPAGSPNRVYVRQPRQSSLTPSGAPIKTLLYYYVKITSLSYVARLKEKYSTGVST